MFLEVLKLVLIILLNKTYADIMQDREIIMLPTRNSTGAKEIPLTLKVFGKLIQLNLCRNNQIISSAFKVWKYNAKDVIEKLSHLKTSDSYFYLHKDNISSAIINFCQENGLEGLIFVESDTLEIRPVRKLFAPLPLLNNVREKDNLLFGKPHLIKKVQYFDDLNLYHWNNLKPKRRYIRNMKQKLTIELAVFFDEAAYRIFMPLLGNDNEKIYRMMLSYVNCIQAAFHHPSLGVSIDISVIRLEIMKKQPLDLPIVDGDYKKLLNLFCEYAKSRNFFDDHDPRHWDIALYLTGIDIYRHLNKNVKQYGVVGGSYMNGVCLSNSSCAIIEFYAASEVSLDFGLCSTGAHEIGHLLGLSHDVEPEDKFKYIMSAKLSNRRRIEWSAGSRNKIKGLWERSKCLRDKISENLYELTNLNYDLPGRIWTARTQCQLILSDEDADVATLYNICQSLQCEIFDKNTYYFTGPALEGTYCGVAQECRNGECIFLL